MGPPDSHSKAMPSVEALVDWGHAGNMGKLGIPHQNSDVAVSPGWRGKFGPQGLSVSLTGPRGWPRHLALCIMVGGSRRGLRCLLLNGGVDGVLYLIAAVSCLRISAPSLYAPACLCLLSTLPPSVFQVCVHSEVNLLSSVFFSQFLSLSLSPCPRPSFSLLLSEPPHPFPQ